MIKKQIKIAIIGAGWSGIGCARMLLKEGYQIKIFDNHSDVGGVWHPDNHYCGLTIHSYAKEVEYFDFPLPSFINKTERITAQQVFSYLQAYCKFHNLYDLMNFNTLVERIDYNSNSEEHELFFKNTNSETHYTEKFTHVIYTHGFCARSIPTIKNLENFSGEAIHSFEVNPNLMQSLVDQNKKVIVVGGSKTATDLILQFQKHAYQVSWLYRKNYWFINRDILHNILDKKEQRKTKMSPIILKLVYRISDFLALIHPKMAYLYMRLLNLIHTFGKKHNDFKRFHSGALDKNQVKLLRNYNNRHYIQGQIESFSKDGVILDNGLSLKADYIIFCTGSGPCQSLIDISIDGKQFDIKNVKTVYRSRVIPQLPHIIFTSFSLFSTGVVNGLCYGNWIIQYIISNFTTSHLEKEGTSYDKPFFQQHFLFDSSDYIARKGLEMLKPFFVSGELSIKYLKEWHMQNTFSTKGAEPLTFKQPKIN